LALRQYGQPGVLNTTTAASAPTCAAAAGSACSLWCCSCLLWDINLGWAPAAAALRTPRSAHDRDSMTRGVVCGKAGTVEGCVLVLCSGGWFRQKLGLDRPGDTNTLPTHNCRNCHNCCHFVTSWCQAGSKSIQGGASGMSVLVAVPVVPRYPAFNDQHQQICSRVTSPRTKQKEHRSGLF
jgi:hypothetical protein